VKDEARDQRAVQTHRQTTDQILQIVLANAVGNDHHRKERNQGSEHQAIDENDEPGFF
jgi:hypothetical protein